MLQEKNKWNHGHCHCLRTQVNDPAFLSSPSHHMYHHTASDQVTSLAENSLYKIVIHFQPHQLPETSWKWAALFLASLVLGFKARWTNLLLSCKNTRKDHDSFDLDKDKLLWNCTPEMKFLIAAKLTKWLAATGRSSSIQVCPNWHCYSVNYSITTHFLWWGLFSSSSARYGHQKSGNAWPRRRGRSRMTSLFCTGKLLELYGCIAKLRCISSSLQMLVSAPVPFVCQHPVIQPCDGQNQGPN